MKISGYPAGNIAAYLDGNITRYLAGYSISGKS